MIINSYRYGGGITSTTWNPSDKSANLTLANGNKTAIRNAGTGFAMVRSTTSKSTGKWYAEIRIDLLGGTDTMLGLDSGAGSLSSYPGNAANGYGYYMLDGSKFNNAASTAYGATYTTNDVIGIAYDAGAGKVWFSKNGTWQASGDPATGANPAFTGVAAGQFLAGAGIYADDTFSLRVLAANFSNTAPSGFSEWG